MKFGLTTALCGVAYHKQLLVPDLSDIARANRTGAALQKVSLPAPRPLFHQESAAKAGAIASSAAAATVKASAAAATVVSSASAKASAAVAETTRRLSIDALVSAGRLSEEEVAVKLAEEEVAEEEVEAAPASVTAAPAPASVDEMSSAAADGNEQEEGTSNAGDDKDQMHPQGIIHLQSFPRKARESRDAVLSVVGGAGASVISVLSGGEIGGTPPQSPSRKEEAAPSRKEEAAPAPGDVWV